MSSLPPTTALAYVRELSADFRAGIVLDATGRPLAGDTALRAPATELLAAHPHTRELQGTAGNGAQIFAARAEDRAIVVVTGPHALCSVIRRDMRTALYGNTRRSDQDFSCEHPERALLDPFATVVADAFRP